MTRATVTPEGVADHVAIPRHDLDKAVRTASRWVVWLLGNGFDVTNDDVVSLGWSSGITYQALASMRKAGWQVERVDGGRGTQPGAAWRATQRPDGSALTPMPLSLRPSVPVALIDAKHSRADAQRAKLYADSRTRQKAKRSKEVEHVGVKVKDAAPSNGRLALIREAPDAPGVGTPLRVGMVAEHSEGTVVALHDEEGRVWFARLDQGDAHG